MPSTDAIDNALYKQLFTRMSEGFALRQLVYDKDGYPCDFRFLDVNPAFQCVSGIPSDKMIGKLASELRKDGRPPQPHFEIFKRVALTGQSEEFEHYVPATDRYFHLYVFCPQRGQFATIVFETTCRRRAEEQLKQREQLFRLLTEQAHDVVYRVILAPVKRFEYVSPALTRMTGYTPEELCDMAWHDVEHIIHPEDLSALRGSVMLDFVKPGTLTTRLFKKDGGIIWVEHSITPINGDDGSLIAVEAIARDVTERKELEATLKHLSLHDSLTGLYNRAFFEEEMRRLDGGRYYPITIVSTDVDGLKNVNDSYGHRRGDELLRSYAAILRSAFRKSDIIARVGGDEFAIVLPQTDAAAAESLSSRLQQLLDEHNRSSSVLRISVSVGAATAADLSTGLAEVFNRADRQMYLNKARRSGFSRVSPDFLQF